MGGENVYRGSAGGIKAFREALGCLSEASVHMFILATPAAPRRRFGRRRTNPCRGQEESNAGPHVPLVFASRLLAGECGRRRLVAHLRRRMSATCPDPSGEWRIRCASRGPDLSGAHGGVPVIKATATSRGLPARSSPSASERWSRPSRPAARRPPPCQGFGVVTWRAVHDVLPTQQTGDATVTASKIMEFSTPRDLTGRPCLPTHHP